MHIASASTTTPNPVPPRDLVVGEPGSPVASGADPRFAQYKVIRRNGSVVGFEPSKITIAMTKALRDLGKAGGKVKMVGFDAGSQSVLDLKNGDVQGLAVQNPVLMGYLSVMTMVKHLRGEQVEKRIDTGVVLVSPENREQPAIKELLNPPLEKYLN